MTLLAGRRTVKKGRRVSLWPHDECGIDLGALMALAEELERMSV
jgi:hypothetical protein